MADNELEDTGRKLSYKELLKRCELLERQDLQKDIELEDLKKREELLRTAMEELRSHPVDITSVLGPDRVVLRGRVHDITKVTTAKALALEDFRKHFVEDDDTVVVIDRKGD